MSAKKSYVEILQELEDCLRASCSEDTVAFNFFMNGSYSSFEFKKRTPEQLQKEGISMRNIKGGFIK